MAKKEEKSKEEEEVVDESRSVSFRLNAEEEELANSTPRVLKEVAELQIMVVSPYSPEHSGEGELEIKEGEVLPLIDVDAETGWIKTELGNKRGWVPAAIVKAIDEAKAPRRAAPKRKEWQAQKIEKGALVRVVCAFEEPNAERTGLLTLKVGEILTFIELDNKGNGWAKGELDKKRGWYPSTFVELVKEPEAPILPPVARSSTRSLNDIQQQELQRKIIESRKNWELFVDRTLDAGELFLGKATKALDTEFESFASINALLEEATTQLDRATKLKEQGLRELRKTAVRGILDVSLVFELDLQEQFSTAMNLSKSDSGDVRVSLSVGGGKKAIGTRSVPNKRNSLSLSSSSSSSPATDKSKRLSQNMSSSTQLSPKGSKSPGRMTSFGSPWRRSAFVSKSNK
eukprot:TRINITY_DN609_c0_g1_i3.p1 TRINITY_DN609_c0_g1~~TRINITY_DN609_c0_g1_i3.p1  ORF type:complete len:402 (-),score=100.10 TRINITY_DN609_c0_g1_i3:99-1304(-)